MCIDFGIKSVLASQQVKNSVTHQTLSPKWPKPSEQPWCYQKLNDLAFKLDDFMELRGHGIHWQSWGLDY